ncbi:MAG: DUF2190 family protein [Planctomycetota bacterium]|jgi:predicted RecA/RadA family phage recombinase|nr:DUF2190 family protein [Planctomycetota bacterium]
MKNFAQTGSRLRLFPSVDVAAGEVVTVGGLVGIAFANYQVADGDGVVCDLSGVYELPKAAGAWTQGQKIYYNHVNKIATTAADNGLSSGSKVEYAVIGLAADVATADAVTGQVLLKN